MLRHYWSTTKHKAWVFLYVAGFCARLLWRAVVHDLSKYRDPEATAFAATLPKLEDTSYGSSEYEELLEELEEALDHHYRVNRHHPEHFDGLFVEDPIRGMTLLDVVEMFCDWRAATRRHRDGDIEESVVTNANRYGFEGDCLNGVLYQEARRVKGKYVGPPPRDEDHSLQLDQTGTVDEHG